MAHPIQTMPNPSNRRTPQANAGSATKQPCSGSIAALHGLRKSFYPDQEFPDDCSMASTVTRLVGALAVYVLEATHRWFADRSWNPLNRYECIFGILIFRAAR